MFSPKQKRQTNLQTETNKYKFVKDYLSLVYSSPITHNVTHFT